MEFKRVLFLKKQMVQKLGKTKANPSEDEVFSMDALTLAYMGDVCWSFFLRERLIQTGICKVQILHTLAAEMVSAKVQSRLLFDLSDWLTERELKVAKRARNAQSAVPKSATVAEYRESTAFEALLGYLYLSGQSARLETLMERALALLAKEYQHGT